MRLAARCPLLRCAGVSQQTVALGQYLPKSDVCVTSVQPPITDSYRTSRQVGSGAKRGHQPPYSITRSARSRTDVGNSTPIAFTVLRFTIVSNLLARSNGRSAGFAPFMILSTNVAARRNSSAKSRWRRSRSIWIRMAPRAVEEMPPGPHPISRSRWNVDQCRAGSSLGWHASEEDRRVTA